MSSTDLITQIIIAMAGVLTPAICVYVANLIKKYIPNHSLLQALQQFAKDAVVVAEKAGFSKQDEDLLSACIEKAYCELKQDIEAVYTGKETDKIYKLSETTDANGNIKPELGGNANEGK